MDLIYRSVSLSSRWGGEGVKGVYGGGLHLVIAICEHHFFRVQENVMQHPSNNILIIIEMRDIHGLPYGSVEKLEHSSTTEHAPSPF